MIEGEHDKNESSDGLIVDAAGIGNGGATRTGRAIDGGCVAIERIQVDGLTSIQQAVAGWVIDLKNIVDGFDDEAVAAHRP